MKAVTKSLEVSNTINALLVSLVVTTGIFATIAAHFTF